MPNRLIDCLLAILFLAAFVLAASSPAMVDERGIDLVTGECTRYDCGE